MNPLPESLALHDSASTTERDSISVRLVQQALLAFTDAGRSPAQLLESLGLSSACLAEPDGRVSVDYYRRMWLGLAERFDDEFFGMDARRLRSGSFVFISRCCVAQPTLEAALRQMLRFYGLTLERFRGRLVRRHSLAEIVLEEGACTPARAFAYFTFWMLVHGLACWLVGRRISLLAVESRCAEPDYTDDYRVMFSENLRFSQASTRIIFAAEVLDLPIRRSEEELRAFLQDAPANILVRYRDSSSLASRIKQLLRERPADRWPDSQTLAGELCMSPATLRRRLAEAGQPYQGIKDAVRRELATRWLADAALSYAEIAERLGFADVSSFYKAFRKWSGTNPGHYRTLILGTADE